MLSTLYMKNTAHDTTSTLVDTATTSTKTLYESLLEPMDVDVLSEMMTCLSPFENEMIIEEPEETLLRKELDGLAEQHNRALFMSRQLVDRQERWRSRRALTHDVAIRHPDYAALILSYNIYQRDLYSIGNRVTDVNIRLRAIKYRCTLVNMKLKMSLLGPSRVSVRQNSSYYGSLSAKM